MKAVLFLGAAPFQVAPIKCALRKGYRVITLDNRPSNPGHALAHTSYNVSTLDKESVVEVAKKERIDGVVVYASDVSAPTAAYVAEQLGLPSNPYEAVSILVDKGRFRTFLNDTGLQPMLFRCFGKEMFDQTLQYVQQSDRDVVVKPTLGSGSRGVGIIRSEAEASAKIQQAFAASLTGDIIVEELVQSAGPQICGDGYMEDGKLAFLQTGDGHFPGNGGLAPCGETFPSSHPKEIIDKVKGHVERVLNEVGFLRGVFNLDVLITADGSVSIIEIGPRGGGNHLERAIREVSGVDLAATAVESALSRDSKLEYAQQPAVSQYAACYMLHSGSEGVLDAIFLEEEDLGKHVIEKNMYISAGDDVLPFTKGAHALGNLVLRFNDRSEMVACMDNIEKFYQVRMK